MGIPLYSSVPTSNDKWQVALLNEKGKCCGLLPCECETKAEAEKYAKSYLGLYS